MSIKKTLLPYLLIVFFAIEAMCVTNYKIRFFPPSLNTIFFISSSIFIILLPFFSKPDDKKSLEALPGKAGFIHKVLFPLIFLGLCIFAIVRCVELFNAIPINYVNADMIPQIKVCCSRLIRGEKVYAPISEIWNGLKPTYLPCMWLVYVPLEFWGKDVRWTSLIIMLLSIGLYFLLFTYNKRLRISYTIGLSIVVVFLFWFLLVKDPFFFPWTEEGVVIGYYLFLGYALIKKNPFLIAIASGLCFLSRYVLIFWIPVYIIYLFIFESKRKSITVASIFTSMVLLIFVFPFFIKQPDYFISIPGGSYRDTAKTSWIESPGMIDNSVGLLRYFRVDQINLIHNLLIFLLFIVPVFCLLLFSSLKRYVIPNKDYFALCSLKLTMLSFYCFVEIPYSYLFFVPVFFSLPIIFKSITGK